jgi:predicted dinucleotide-binding enzyme
VANGCVKPVAFPSAAQVLQGYLPGARVVKAFNQLGAAKLAQPLFADGMPWMGVAGDDDSSVQRVADLARSFGFNAVPFGKLSAALHLEDMARIWIHGAYVAGLGPGIGFALLRG